MEFALNTMSNTVNCLTKQIELKDAEIARLREQLARGSFAVEEALVTAVKSKKSGKPTKSKDPNAPKKPATAWMMWKNEVFGPAFKLSNPGESIAKASGLAWKALSDEEKLPWQTKYVEAKTKYDKEPRTVTFVSDESELSEQSDEVSAINIIDNDIASESGEEYDCESDNTKQVDDAVVVKVSKADKKAEKEAKKTADKEAKKAAKKEKKKQEKKEAKKAAKNTNVDIHVHNDDIIETKDNIVEESDEVVNDVVNEQHTSSEEDVSDEEGDDNQK